MTNMTDLKLISLDAAVDNMMQGITHLEVIVANLNETVGALEAKETQLEKQIDMLVKELKDTRYDNAGWDFILASWEPTGSTRYFA